MDPYSSPAIIPNNNPYNPISHSLLSTRESPNDHFRDGVLKPQFGVYGFQVLCRTHFAHDKGQSLSESCSTPSLTVSNKFRCSTMVR